MSERASWKRHFGLRHQPVCVLVALAVAHSTTGEPLTCEQIAAMTKNSDDPVPFPNSYTAALARMRYIERAEPIPGKRTIRWRILDRGLKLLGLATRKGAAA
jgi:hypothetical protein